MKYTVISAVDGPLMATYCISDNLSYDQMAKFKFFFKKFVFFKLSSVLLNIEKFTKGRWAYHQ